MTRDQPPSHVLLQFDWTASESASAAVIKALAAVSDTGPTDLPPLYEAVDPDALDALVPADPQSSIQEQIGVTFTFNDYFIEISPSGNGRICNRNSDSAA